jgi:serine/threonine protein kinase
MNQDLLKDKSFATAATATSTTTNVPGTTSLPSSDSTSASTGLPNSVANTTVTRSSLLSVPEAVLEWDEADHGSCRHSIDHSSSSDVDSVGTCIQEDSQEGHQQNQQQLQHEQQMLLQEMKCLKAAKQFLIDCVNSSKKLNDQYTLHSLLGYGTFGICLEAYHDDTLKKVAVKVMKKEQIHNSRFCLDPQNGQKIPLEVALLKYTPQHKNILKFIDAWCDDYNWFLVTELSGHTWSDEAFDEDSGLPHIITEKFLRNTDSSKFNDNYSAATHKMSVKERVVVDVSNVTDKKILQRISIPAGINDGSLAGFLKACGAFSNDRSINIPESVQRHIFIQLLDAVQLLHKNGITHKDLKDENVLLDENLKVTLIDFGHACFYKSPNAKDSNQQEELLFKSYGTPIFSPPETRSQLKFQGTKADVYALGLMLYEMNYGDLPYNYDQAFYEPEAECIFEFPFGSELLRDLLNQMLQPDPEYRLDIEQALQHPWFTCATTNANTTTTTTNNNYDQL